MKLLLSILVLTLLGTCYSQHRPGFTPMAPNDYTHNALIKTLEGVGNAFILKRAFDTGRIYNQNFTIGTINYILNKTTTNATYFDMNMTLVNAQNDTIEAAYVIAYFPSNKTNQINAFTFSIVYGAASIAAGLDTAYEPVPEDEYDTPLIQDLANTGKDHLVRIMVARKKIPAGTYNVTKINTVEKLNLVDGSDYQLNLNFSQAGGLNEVNADIRERYFTANKTIDVLAFQFNVLNKTANATSSSTTTTPATTL